MWGYYLATMGSGEINIPLQTKPGLKIKSLTCRFIGPKANIVLYASTPGIPAILISKNPAK